MADEPSKPDVDEVAERMGARPIKPAIDAAIDALCAHLAVEVPALADGEAFWEKVAEIAAGNPEVLLLWERVTHAVVRHTPKGRDTLARGARRGIKAIPET